ncbi:GyrI-like domain-containing protein [Roseburia sp. 1XD42-69]|uniref:GyrI-like domain-containing protein n=1 Tax=Roseburia sp. 1XD42-69 TaxID=2320088 RepID=UPI000EA3B9A5|nr:GyrI-like domain-containing protein [Roseburia sp. 1XD42-69]RKJ61434.1 small molecule-binding protein [Roseburia sp. 1XD42-69]
MKHEWKKQEKEIYGVKTKPCVIDIPAWKYIILSGSGNPNDEIFSDKVATLFSIAYKIKMAYKTLAEKSNEITDYTVYPLEGIWSTASEKGYLVKEELQYRIMIRQPDFITREMFDNSLEAVKSKKYNPYLTDVSFETICDGMCIQVLHKGAFDDEPASFEIMDRYCMEHGYRRMGKEHREIYLNNANRTEKVNLKTILRYKVTDIENILL